MVQVGFLKRSNMKLLPWYMKLAFWLGELRYGRQEYIHVVLRAGEFTYSYSYPGQEVYFTSDDIDWDEHAVTWLSPGVLELYDTHRIVDRADILLGIGHGILTLDYFRAMLGLGMVGLTCASYVWLALTGWVTPEMRFLKPDELHNYLTTQGWRDAQNSMPCV